MNTLVYTTVQHNFRREHDLSLNEYVLLDMIHLLSSSKSRGASGWCYMSKQTMAEELNLSKQAILNLIKKLIGSGFLEKQKGTSFLRTTVKWEAVYFRTDGKESLPLSVNKVYQSGKESLPNNNNIIIEDNKPLTPEREPTLFTLEEKKKKQEQEKTRAREISERVIQYLGIAKRRFVPHAAQLKNTPERERAISKLIARGNDFEQFQAVIDWKVQEWSTDEKMKKYLTPETLFRVSNFQKYLEEARENYHRLKKANEGIKDSFK